MSSYTLKTIISIGLFIILFFIALSVLKWAIRVLLPIAVIIIAIYIVYKFFNRSRF